MSLIKLLKSPIKLFKKDVITFVIVKRHDLGIDDKRLRYIAVKPSASISQIRQKVWHLLDLPDYCEEIIILKDPENRELPLTQLRKGNDPQHPYLLEVWLPEKSMLTSSTLHNMLTMGERSIEGNLMSALTTEDKENRNDNGKLENNEAMPHTTINRTMAVENFIADYKQSNLSCKISTSSVFFKLHGKKSRDNFANLLLKIQSDLTMLSTKLSNLENRIQV